MMVISLRGCRLAAGQIRRLYRQSVNFIPAQAAYSWTENSPSPDRPIVSPGGFQITRALRYMTRSVYAPNGADNTRFAMLHTKVENRVMYKTVTINQGQKRNLPTVRNRMTSFGSRVPTLNRAVDAAQSQYPGGATQP